MDVGDGIEPGCFCTGGWIGDGIEPGCFSTGGWIGGVGFVGTLVNDFGSPGATLDWVIGLLPFTRTVTLGCEFYVSRFAAETGVSGTYMEGYKFKPSRFSLVIGNQIGRILFIC